MASGALSFAVMTWAAGSNSFSPDHRPGFAAGAIPPWPPPPASRTNDLHGLMFGLLFEHHGEQNQAVAQRAGHRNRVQSGKCGPAQNPPLFQMLIDRSIGRPSPTREALRPSGSGPSSVPAPKSFLRRQNSSAPALPTPRRPQPRSLSILLRLPRLSTWPRVIARDPQARR